MTPAEQRDFPFPELDHVRQRCRGILSTSAVSYEALIKALQGTSPDVVVMALNEMEYEDQVKTILDQAATPNIRIHAQGSLLPLPHPSDAEWRFDPQTVDLLLDEAEAVTKSGDRILLFGTPGAAIGALGRQSERNYSVLSPKNVVTDAIMAATLNDERFRYGKAPIRSCGAVLIDPPWYLPAYEEMLTTAASLCRKGAHLYLSVPSEGTRPTASGDVERIISFAASVGFRLADKRPGALRYINPLFEVSAFAAQGIFAPDGWRRSDMLVFKLIPTQLPFSPSVTGGRSFELTVGGCRLRLNITAPINTPVNDDFHPVARGEVFPSVSNRHPDRRKANFWTSTNRAFSINPAKAILAMAFLAADRGIVLPARLGTHVKGAQLKGAVDKIHPLIQKLEELVATETRDSQRLTQGTPSWLSTANDARFLND